jgi:hypothetical protein
MQSVGRSYCVQIGNETVESAPNLEVNVVDKDSISVSEVSKRNCCSVVAVLETKPLKDEQKGLSYSMRGIAKVEKGMFYPACLKLWSDGSMIYDWR